MSRMFSCKFPVSAMTVIVGLTCSPLYSSHAEEFETFDIKPSGNNFRLNPTKKAKGDRFQKVIPAPEWTKDRHGCVDGLRPPKKAIEICSKVIADGAADALTFKVRGNAYYFLKNYDAALADYRQAMKLQPDWDSPYFNQAVVNYALGKFHEALWDLETVLHLNPNKTKAWVLTASSFRKLRRYKDAASAYAKVLEFDATDAEAKKWKSFSEERDAKRHSIALFRVDTRGAQQLQKAGRLDEAIDTFTAAIDQMRAQEQSPARNIFMARAMAFRARARFDNDDAKTASKEVFDLIGESPGIIFFFPDIAIDAATYALIGEPDNAAVLDILAKAYSRDGKFDEAAQVRGKLLRIARNDYERAKAHYDRGIALALAGKPVEAIADYTFAIHVIPSPGLYANRASSYANTGDFKAAIADYTKALSMEEKGSDAYGQHLIARGRTKAEAGHVAEAIEDYRTLLAMAPEKTEARKELILALANAGRIEEAKADLAELKEKFPKDFKQFRPKLVGVPALADMSGIAAENRVKPRIEAKGEDALLQQINALLRDAEWVVHGQNGIVFRARHAAIRPELTGRLQIVNLTCVSDGRESDRKPVRKGRRLVKGCPDDPRQWNLAILSVDLLKADAAGLDIVEPPAKFGAGEGAAVRIGCTNEGDTVSWRECIRDKIHEYQAAGQEARRGPIVPGLVCKGEENCKQAQALLANLVKRVQAANPDSASPYWDTVEADIWCRGPKAFSGVRSISACGYLIDLGAVNADGSEDKTAMANLYASRGYGLGLLKRHNAAYADLDRAVALDPGKAVYYDARALAASHLGKKGQARKDREKACSLDKKYCK